MSREPQQCRRSTPAFQPIQPVLHPAAVTVAAHRPRRTAFLIITAASGPGTSVVAVATTHLQI